MTVVGWVPGPRIPEPWEINLAKLGLRKLPPLEEGYVDPYLAQLEMRLFGPPRKEGRIGRIRGQGYRRT